MLCTGNCIFNDNIEDRNYTLHFNGTWIISQRCNPPQVQVTCSNGSWSEDISCQVYTAASQTAANPVTTRNSPSISTGDLIVHEGHVKNVLILSVNTLHICQSPGFVEECQFILLFFLTFK